MLKNNLNTPKAKPQKELLDNISQLVPEEKRFGDVHVSLSVSLGSNNSGSGFKHITVKAATTIPCAVTDILDTYAVGWSIVHSQVKDQLSAAISKILKSESEDVG